FVAMDAASRNQRNVFVFNAEFFEELARPFQHSRKGVGCVVDAIRRGRTQVATSKTGVFNDDGVRQTILAHPFFQDDRNATDIRQNWDDGCLGKISGQIGKIQRQAGTHDHGISPTFAGLAYLFGVLLNRLHEVNRYSAVATRQLAFSLVFAVESDEVYLVDERLVTGAAGLFHEVGMMATQVNAGNGSERAKRRYSSSQPVGRNAYA